MAADLVPDDLWECSAPLWPTRPSRRHRIRGGCRRMTGLRCGGASPANVHATNAGKLLLDDLAAAHPSVTKVWADGGYQNSIFNHGARLGIDVEVVQRPRTRGFEPLPTRWVIDRTFGWLMQQRRLVRDHEALPERSRAMIHWAMANKCPAN
ncbi:transposase [Streptomyces sp. NPDC006475]|uniref:transposase n=1 Tax=Streptomyces sp. NPDC006475 TaxID=3155719 RepID=UPI00339E5B95